MILEFILIPFIIVMVYDYTEFPREFLVRFYNIILQPIFKHPLSKESIRLPKILECSFCATFWCSLILCLCTQPISGLIIWVAISLLNAFLSNYYYMLIMFLDNLFKKMFYKLNQLIQEIRFL